MSSSISSIEVIEFLLPAAILMEKNQNSSTRTDRKIVERNRRNKMKTLSSMLNSLVPQQSSRESFSMPDQLHEATNYIKKLQINLEKLKDKKNTLEEIQRANMSTNRVGGSKFPQIEIQQMGLALVVSLITGLDCHFMFKECIRVLGEEGADIVSANYIVSEDSILHTIHSQIEESSNGARISERVKTCVYDSLLWSNVAF
ncbi:PREDICTED: transcription factor bHLH125-like isoform X2 [Lupinus angustifolius]|uniref:transcription factor bHLH125-like isoform X1 n=1 Tax=Lupinus angustifolius TaxID=3871 RepID=UPI00092F03D7|nr:PREDICTED: transcription factor bHLH125-like isoform X1 [Lupinus angustifolius]XP_019440248.1 PREDICTED: transcription factor bHLH125-like isoform X2 [Lupinus angustifolius]